MVVRRNAVLLSCLVVFYFLPFLERYLFRFAFILTIMNEVGCWVARGLRNMVSQPACDAQ